MLNGQIITTNDFVNFQLSEHRHFTVLKKRNLKKSNELKASKRSGKSTKAVIKAEGNLKPYGIMTWLVQYLQMREGRSNIAATNREDDTKEDLSDNNGLIANPINSKTSGGFSNVENVAKDNSEIKNSFNPVTNLSKKNKNIKEEVVDNVELDLFVFYEVFVTKEILTLLFM